MTASENIQIPTDILLDPKLVAGDIVAYMKLLHYAKAHGSLSQELFLGEIGIIIGKSAEQARRHLVVLEREGLVHVHRFRGSRANRYTIIEERGEQH